MTAQQKRNLNGGRKRLDYDVKRSGKVDIRVNAAEKAELSRLADVAGLPLSKFVRLAALGCTIDAPPPLQNIEAYRSLVKVGNLLNQAMWKVHSGQIQNIEWEILSDLKRDVKSLALDLLGAGK